jgi:hypothetical protein
MRFIDIAEIVFRQFAVVSVTLSKLAPHRQTVHNEPSLNGLCPGTQ